MEIVEVSINYIQKRFPEVSILRNQTEIVFEGRFIIEAKYKDFIIDIAPRLRLVMHENYPETLPIVYDTDDIIEYDHKYTDCSLCVATPIDLHLKLFNSYNISDYIENFLIPYFISYEYWRKTDIDIFGDRSHGFNGIRESLLDFFCLNEKERYYLPYLVCWAARSKKFKKVIPKEFHILFLKKYSEKISQLRNIGIHRLQALNKFFIKFDSLTEKEKTSLLSVFLS